MDSASVELMEQNTSLIKSAEMMITNSLEKAINFTSISPVFYGGDLNQGFFVLEDLGEYRSLVDPLLHGDAAMVETGLLKYDACLGTRHAMTAGKAGMFGAMFSARFPGHRPFAD